MKIRLWFGLALLLAAPLVLAQTWRASRSPESQWSCIASTPDGTKMIAAQFPGGVFISTNSGLTWKITSNRNKYWSGVAITPDGGKLLAAAAGFPDDESVPGGVFMSTNFGYTWTSYSLPRRYWGSVVMSADGNTLAAASVFGNQMMDALGGVFASTNGGRLWKFYSLKNAVSLAASADGRKMVVAAPLGSYRSTNSGATWTQMTNAPAIYGWCSPSKYIASSADGTRLAMCDTPTSWQAPHIYVSTNSGDTWRETTAPGNDWGCVAMSADGATIAATPFYAPGTICLSTNGGLTWTTNSPNTAWRAIAVSGDGSRLAATMGGAITDGVTNGRIYIAQ